MSVGIEAVARAAGVSTATVSRALRGLPHVAAGTRERVLAAAQDLRYELPVPATPRPASASTGSVGVLVPYVARWYFAQVISGAESALRAAGLDLVLYNIGGLDDRRRVFRHQIVGRRVDAVIVISLPASPEEEDSLAALGVPVVLVGERRPGLTSISIDDDAGARTATQHLVNLGHTRIGLISGGPETEAFASQRIRREAFQEVLLEAGLRVDARHEAHGDFTLRGGTRAMDELLARANPPTAVFAESDEMAFGAMRAIRRHGLSVPEDLSIVGFDGHEMADLLDLTTVEQPVALLGEMAAWTILERLREPATPPASVTVPTTLVVRGSTRRHPA